MVSRLCLATLLIALPGTASAGSGYHPFAKERNGVRTVDLSAQGIARGGEGYVMRQGYPDAPSFETLDDVAAQAAADGSTPAPLPEGAAMHGSVVVSEPIAAGELVDPDVVHAVEDIPGNEYPRKHTLYLNYTGGMLFSGADNSAESRSSLARQGNYPVYSGGESKAIAAAQETANDVAAFGINVVYLERPPKVLPYTMVMIGGSWTDTNIEDPAGGVAPGTDCGALGQRHVVYTFATGGWSATAISNVNSQEAGHAWGLDHSLNCNSVMSYCGSGDGIFSDTCDGLCETTCQGAAGCRLFHEDFCGEGADEQNEAEELSFIFGGNEPDLEPPMVEIVSPTEGMAVENGGNVDLRAIVDDNYGGYGWRFQIERDGEVLFDQVDYDREVDPEYRAALNLVGLETGVYTITVEITDHFEHVTTDTVTFTVGDAEIPDTGGVDGDSSGGGMVDDGEFTTTATASDSDTDGSAIDDSDSDKGCACQAGEGSGGAGWTLWGVLGLWGLRRSRTRNRRGC